MVLQHEKRAKKERKKKTNRKENPILLMFNLPLRSDHLKFCQLPVRTFPTVVPILHISPVGFYLGAFALDRL